MNREEKTSNLSDADSPEEPQAEILDCPEVALDTDSDMDFILTVKLSDSSVQLDTADSDQQIVNMAIPIETATVISTEIAELQEVLPPSEDTECEYYEVVYELSGGENAQGIQTSELNMPPEVPASSTFVRRARTRAPRRGRGVRVRGGRASQPVVVQKVVQRRGGRRGRHRGRPGPRTIDELIISDVGDLPTEQAIETPIHPKRRRTYQPSTSAALAAAEPGPSSVASTSAAPSGSRAAGSPLTRARSKRSKAMSTACGGDSAQSTSPESLRSPPNPRRILHDENIAHALFYGSESESGESDDEHVPSYIPRAAWSVLDTPREEHDELATAEPVPEESVIEEFVTEEPVPEESVIEEFVTEEPVPEESVTEEPVTEESLADYIPPASATDQPSRLFDFEWRPFPNPPIPSISRREPFLQSNAGPAAPCVDPYDIFTTIWDRQIMEYIASETNRYARQLRTQMRLNNALHPSSRISQWHETTADELYVFFGLMLAMGMVVKSRIEDYWSADPDVLYTPGFSAHMSKNRFLLLCRCLHFANNDDMRALELGTSEAKLFKIKPILSHLSLKFETMYTPRQNIALDESLLMWKGWSNISQQIPNKAAKMGIKTYEICESRTGYLWRFEVHSHKACSPAERSKDPLNATTPATVLRLIQGLEYKGYTLWMDNYYNSPCLARRLKSLGLDCAGTLRTNRKFVPQALHNLTNDKMSAGQISGLTAGDVDILVFRDRNRANRVAMISTYHGNTTSRNTGAIKPNVILDYNIMMGGVDKKDQMLAQYPIERKRTKVWYKKLFRRLLNVSVLNSYIIHRESSPPSSHLYHLQFRVSLLKSLLSKHRSGPAVLPPPLVVKPQEHRITMTQFVGGTGKYRLRRRCAICKRRVVTICVGCDKGVCMEPCFLTLHQSKSSSVV